MANMKYKVTPSALAISLFWSAVIPLIIPLKFSSDRLHQLLQFSSLILLFLVMLWICNRIGKQKIPLQAPRIKLPSTWLMIGAISICAIIWSIYGFVFYPGIITWDFYVQWHEMSGKIPLSDWHPAFHTLLMWVVTRIWFSPAIVTLVQVAAMSVLVGITAVRLAKNGVPLMIVALMVLFYAFFPLNGFYAVSLWKDIGYALAFFWLNILLFDVVFSKGSILAKRSFQMLFFLALCCVALIRHNGLIPAFGSLLVLLAIYFRSQSKPILLLMVALAAFIFLFKGPVFHLLKVNVTDKNVLKAHLPIQHIGAVLHAGGDITQEDKVFLAQIMPLSYWKKAYDPRSCMPLIFGKDKNGTPYLDGDFLKNHENYRKFLSVWTRTALTNPAPIMNYYLYGTELLWRIHTRYSPFVIADEDLAEDHLYSGYKPSQKLSEHVGPVGSFLIHLINNNATGWLFHRGAFYFWTSLFFLSLLALRADKVSIIAIVAPMLLQAFTVAAFPLVQDTRFMFPIILVTPLLISLFFSNRLTASAGTHIASS